MLSFIFRKEFLVSVCSLLMGFVSVGSLFAASSLDENRQQVDVVICCCQKDVEILNFCIRGIKTFGKDIGRVVVISKEPLTDQAEWFDESLFPFNLKAIGEQIFPNDSEQATWFAGDCRRRGWIYQQLLKLYAPFVIPSLSSNVLILDSDVVFLRPVRFLTEEGVGLYAVGTEEYHRPYFEHMQRLLPSLARVFPSHSGICHHMLFQKKILEALFADIGAQHGREPWQALCRCIDPAAVNGSSLSEYEIYFNYLFSRGYKAQIRSLTWTNKGDFSEKIFSLHTRQGFDYVAYHSHSRTQAH